MNYKGGHLIHSGHLICTAYYNTLNSLHKENCALQLKKPHSSQERATKVLTAPSYSLSCTD